MAEEKKTRKRKAKAVIEVTEDTAAIASETITSEPAEIEAIPDAAEAIVEVEADSADVEVIEPTVEEAVAPKIVEPLPEITEPIAEAVESKPKKSRAKKAPKEVKEEPAKNYIDIDKPIFLYKTSVSNKPIQQIRGRYYIWDPAEVTGRLCVTESEKGIGVLAKIAGWINVSDITR